MAFFYFLFFFVLASVTIILIYAFAAMKDDAPFKLFIEGLKDENNGDFEEALATYKNALKGFEKIRAHKKMKNKIAGKLELLQTIIEYKNNFQSHPMIQPHIKP